MAQGKTQVLYVVWSATEKRSYGEFLNKDCAVRHMGTTMLRLAGREYGKFIQESKHTLTYDDYWRYGRLHLEDFYVGNFTLKRKIWNDKVQGFTDFDEEYEFSMKENIDRHKLESVLVETAMKIIGAPGKENSLRRSSSAV